MAHVWWHNCLTVGDDTGKKVPLKLREGKRGNASALFRFPHDWDEAKCKEVSAKADALFMELVGLFRQSQESIVFNPMQGTPSAIEEPPHEH
jgi:hypothetical protein